jgi:hypothetical protein
MTCWRRIRIPNTDPYPGGDLKTDPPGYGSETLVYAMVIFVLTVPIPMSGMEHSEKAGVRYTRCLFLLSQALIHLADKRFTDANPLLHQVHHFLPILSVSNNWDGVGKMLRWTLLL